MTLPEKPFIVRIRIRDLRKEQSLTQEHLAELLGISRQSVIALESGKYMPSLPLAMQLAEVFRLPLEHIFMSEDEVVTTAPAVCPAINLSLTDEAIILEAAVVGYTQKEIAVEVEERAVLMAGQLDESKQPQQYLAREISAAPFRRQVMLPYAVDPDRSTAQVNDGLLTVTMPLKKETDTKKRLTIT